MILDRIPLYAVYEDGELYAFSFDAQPGNADTGRTHRSLDRNDPGAPLLLAGFSKQPEACAFVAGLQYAGDDRCGCVVRYFAPDLTCVLVEFFDGTPEGPVTIVDMRQTTRKAGAA